MSGNALIEPTVCQINQAAGTATCDLGDMPAKATAKIKVRVKVKDEPPGKVLDNIVNITSTTGELIPADNTFVLQTTLN